MALALHDRVRQGGTANTTVSFTLSSTVLGFQDFSVIGNGNTTYYAASDLTGNWEVGIGTYSTTGPTLTRTTILSSSNSGSAVTFSGAIEVWVTYPSEKSINLDDSGNASALGTIASGTWQGSTVGVAYGGTGVTSSSGANSVVLRDANQNITVNRLNQGLQTITASGGTTILTVASQFNQALVGTGNQTFRLPDATTLSNTTAFQFNNNATGTLTIQDNAGATVGTISSGGAAGIALLSNGTIAGTWDVHAYIPENVTWGTNSLALGSTVISGGTWQGGTIASGYGGTGLTTFSSANNALYSTSSSALVAGTLPVAAGGTGATSLTANNVLLGNGTSALQVVAPGTNGNVLTSNGTTWTSTAPVTGVTVTNDTSTATALFPTFTSATSGSISGVSVTSTKLNFTPSTGTLAAPQVNATNGIVVNSKTIATTYSIPSGSNAMSAGPVTVSSGATVTVPTGSRWVVL